MGEVYLATQLSLNRPVALKVLRSNFASNPTYLGRLRTEATAVAKLNHPNIVHVYTLGCIDQINFIAMEYVQGTNLRDYIIKKGALDLPLAFSIMRQTGQAIGAAGEVGLVHRDVKPENILITKKGRVKVADFGLCRDQEGAAGHLTQSGVTMGTPLYMSPEQAQGHSIDHRSDLYSLGVTFYHMLAGVPPFHAETALALALKQVREAPRSMLIHRPDLPPELDRLVLKLMAKSPRIGTSRPREMLADLAKMRESLPAGRPRRSVTQATDLTSRSRSDLWRPSWHDRPAKSGCAGSAENESGRGRPLRRTGGCRGRALGSPESWPLIIATCTACLLIGAAVGWSSRATRTSWRSRRIPALPARALARAALEVRSEAEQCAKSNSATHFLQAPRDEWAPAFLAVAGYFPHSHDLISKAYTQLARIWYRRCDLTRSARWKPSSAAGKKRRNTIKTSSSRAHRHQAQERGLRRGRQGMKNLTRDEVPDMYDTALVEMSLEICADAIKAADTCRD